MAKKKAATSVKAKSATAYYIKGDVQLEVLYFGCLSALKHRLYAQMGGRASQSAAEGNKKLLRDVTLYLHERNVRQGRCIARFS